MNFRIYFLIGIGLLGTALADEPTKGFSPREARYRIQRGDVVEVKFRYTPEYNQTATVQPDGFLLLEIVGEVRVGGLTVPEATSAVRELSAQRLREPEVNLILKEFVKPQFTVNGEVAKPGMYDLRGTLTVTQAIALAGGFNQNAKHSSVALVRRVDDRWAEVKVLDLKRMMKPGGFAEDITLASGDMLVVPKSAFGRMERFVSWASLAAFGISAFRRY